jgi:L-seryl-tRNA(Ser) seleniumtransferase
VERLLATVRPMIPDATGADALAAVAREVVAGERTRLAAGAPPTGLDALADEVRLRLAAFSDPLRSGLTQVLNATGVILHTNLGRAPWPAEAIEVIRSSSSTGKPAVVDRGSGPPRRTSSPSPAPRTHS